jgi:hypothetical protein
MKQCRIDYEKNIHSSSLPRGLVAILRCIGKKDLEILVFPGKFSILHICNCAGNLYSTVYKYYNTSI